jgi:hypothetical protein
VQPPFYVAERNALGETNGSGRPAAVAAGGEPKQRKARHGAVKLAAACDDTMNALPRVPHAGSASGAFARCTATASLARFDRNQPGRR